MSSPIAGEGGQVALETLIHCLTNRRIGMVRTLPIRRISRRPSIDFTIVFLSPRLQSIEGKTVVPWAVARCSMLTVNVWAD